MYHIQLKSMTRRLFYFDASSLSPYNSHESKTGLALFHLFTASKIWQENNPANHKTGTNIKQPIYQSVQAHPNKPPRRRMSHHQKHTLSYFTQAFTLHWSPWHLRFNLKAQMWRGKGQRLCCIWLCSSIANSCIQIWQHRHRPVTMINTDALDTDTWG